MRRRITKTEDGIYLLQTTDDRADHYVNGGVALTACSIVRVYVQTIAGLAANTRREPTNTTRGFGSMTIMHMALGALSSIFGAHLSWALTDWIIKRRNSGRPVFWAAAAAIAGVVVLVVGLGVLFTQTTEV